MCSPYSLIHWGGQKKVVLSEKLTKWWVKISKSDHVCSPINNKKINYFFHIPLTKTNQEHLQCAHNKYTEVFSYMAPDPLQQGLLQQAPKTIAHGYSRTSFQFHKGVICHYFLLQCLPKKQKKLVSKWKRGTNFTGFTGFCLPLHSISCAFFSSF